MPFYTKTNKSIRNYQKKKYYTNRNTRKYKVLSETNNKSKGEVEYYYNPLKKE